MQLSFSLSTIETTAQQVWDIGKDFSVWAFHGEMGSGKTTFITSLCNVLQVSSSVSSPTYSIINEYFSSVAGTMYHMDWYRLSGEEEALQAGVEDALYSTHLCLVEWPERADKLLPPDTLHIFLEMIDADIRSLHLHIPGV